MVISHHFWCEHSFISTHLFDHTMWCFIKPFGLCFLPITCDGTVYCWSHHKTCWSHHRHFVHTIRCASHHIPWVTPARYHHTVFVCSYQGSMNNTMESGSHRIVLSTRVTCFTPKLYLHTEVVHVHTRNKFIHTEIEQTIQYSIHITLHQVISYSKLPPLTHTNGTDTHEESGRNPHS